MRYGYFDGPNKEYVIDKPNTPGAWANYLGNPAYGGIITNNAAGYSFVKSGATGRLIRYRFNSVPKDQTGRLIYLRDAEDGDFWSASWQPVGKDLNEYKSLCKHGTGYTIISSDYKGIATETTYMIPLNKMYEVWSCKVKNNSDKKRKINLFGFVEMTTAKHYEQDTVNLQYTYFIGKTYYKDNYILQAINEFCAEADAGSSAGISNDRVKGDFKYFGAAGQKASSYDGDRDAFIGDYRDYSNPIAVVNGKCSNVLNYNMNSCGALGFDLELEPGEEKFVNFVFGEGEGDLAEELIVKYEDLGQVDRDLAEIKEYWHSKLNRLQINTPDENFNHMINTWNSYQCLMTTIWSRAASLTYCGQRNGLGYRDTVQDIQGSVHIDPELAGTRLELMLSGQVDNGGGLPLVRWDFVPGKEGTPDDAEYAGATGHPYYRADDALWLFPTVETYINETGDKDFLDKEILFSNKGKGTVYEHLKRAIQFNLDRLGDHELPAGLHADWNDCLRLGKKGESAFVTFQLYLAIKNFKKYASQKNRLDDYNWADGLQEKYLKLINETLWNEDRFVRGIAEDGYVVGNRDNAEGSMWLNPQSWSVISGAATKEQAITAMDNVEKILNTKYGAALFKPSFKEYGLPVARMALMNPGTKENAGIFSQSQGWLILAEAMLGRGNKAFNYYKEINPASMNDDAEIRVIEPYAHGQSVESDESPFFGRGHVHWLTGTASTVMVALVYGILGLRPDLDGMRIDPCIPSEWDGFEMTRIIRNKELNIVVENSNHVEKGVKMLVVNGVEYEGSYVPFDALNEKNDIKVIMG